VKKWYRHTGLMTSLGFILMVVLLGILAPIVAPHNPFANSIMNKFAPMSKDYFFGTDHLGRCIFSRMLYGIRPTLFYSFLIMLGTMGIGTILGMLAGYKGGKVDEVIMRFVDILLSFPSQVIILAVIAVAGININNVIITSILIKWAWYSRMIRGSVMKFRESPFIIFSKSIGMKTGYILRKHLLPNITADLTVLASLDMGWAILNISTLSFLGLGVQAPIPEWGAMLNEAKNVLGSNPIQMIFPGLGLMLLIGAFHFLGDHLRDVLDPKEV